MMPMPDIDRWWHRVQTGEYGGTGGGQSRHGFEVGVGKRQSRQMQQQRNRRECRQQRPYRGDQQVTVTDFEITRAGAAGKPQDQRGDKRDQKSFVVG
jgi:hypothetical protein